jgi:hypothetical protein
MPRKVGRFTACKPPCYFSAASLQKNIQGCMVVSENKKEADTMRLILKILVAPIIVVLTLFVWICSGLLYCSSFILGLAGTVLGILGVLVLLTGSFTNGIIVLVMAFLVSPFGIPMAAVWLIGKIQDFRYTIQDKVYG